LECWWFSCTAGQALVSNGTGAAPTWQGVTASAVALSSITAATGTNSINNGNNAQTWNWDLTSTTNGMNFTENAASSGTGSIVSISTLASSTAIPLTVKAQGNTIFTSTADGSVALTNQGSTQLSVLGTPGGGNVLIAGGATTGGVTVRGGNTASSGDGGAAVFAGGGAGFTTGNGGSATLNGGAAFTAGNGGAVFVTGGNGGSSSGNGGIVTIQAGQGAAGTPGTVVFKTGNASTTRFTIDGTGTWLLAGSAGSANQVLTTNGSGAAPTWTSVVNSLTGTANEITVSASTGAVTLSVPSAFIAPGSVEVTSTLKVDSNTADAFLYSDGSKNVVSTAAATNGQLLIGSTGSVPVAATLTAGSGISITNGAGTITIASTAGAGAVGTVTATVPLNANGTTNIGGLLPAGATILEVKVNVTVADTAAVLTIGKSGSTSAYMAATENDPQTVGLYVAEDMVN
jgi:hypothetical protein